MWQAAKTKGRSHKNKDETGVMLATCRHMLVLKALDMSRGEIYEYPYILQVSHYHRYHSLQLKFLKFSISLLLNLSPCFKRLY